MKSHRFVQVMTIGLVICSMVVFAVGAIGSSDPNTIRSQDNNEHRVGGGGGRVSGQHVSGERPTQTSAKLVPGTKTARRAMGVNRHVLAAPEKFPKDGVYIWCDPDGLWTMFWKGRRGCSVNAIVTAKEPIVVESCGKREIDANRKPNELDVVSAPMANRGIIQFTSEVDSVGFQILINGSSDPNHVFIGSRLKNPRHFPLKLATRRTFARKPTLAIERQLNAQSDKTVTAIPCSKISGSVAPARMSGGGGKRSEQSEQERTEARGR